MDVRDGIEMVLQNRLHAGKGRIACPLAQSVDGRVESLGTAQDGSQHILNQNLNTPLSANTRLTLNIVLGEIHTGSDAGNFTIEDWNESTETIEFPIID